jgi:hypothetical protein
MKFADRLKFTATGTSAATITFSAAVPGFRTLAQAIADGAYVVGDTGVPFTIDDGAGNKETSLFTITSATVLTRTSVRSSSTGGATPATFTGATLNVFSSMPADFASRLVIAAAITGIYAVGETLTAAYPTDTIGTIQFVRTLLVAPYTRTAIATAVANAVNSLTYKVTIDDAGYRLDVDCSNQVSTVTGGAVPTMAAASSSGVMRLIGSGNQQAAAGALNGSYNSAVVKLQAPGGAIGVRVIFTNASPSYGMAGAKVAVASTEIAACDTAANAYTPMIGGVAKNVMATTSDAGFVKGKWGGGNTTSRRLSPTNSVLPSFGYNSQEEYLCSDVIPLVPKRATDRTREEYHYIFRVACVGANGQDGQTQIEGGTGKVANVLYNQWLNTDGADSPLICVGGLANTVDGVDGNLATIPGGIANGYSPVFHVEWIYPTGVVPVTFLHSGDSITEGYEWPRWAVQRRNTNPLRPLHHVNLGASTTRTLSFMGNLFLYLQANAKPQYIVFPIMSPNNYSPSSNFNTTTAAVEYANLQEYAQYVLSLGIKLILWTPINWGPNPSDPADMSTPWNLLYNSIKPYCAANGIYFMDVNADSQVLRTDYNATTNPGGWLEPNDHLHPSNPTGKAGFARVYSAFLASLGF